MRIHHLCKTERVGELAGKSCMISMNKKLFLLLDCEQCLYLEREIWEEDWQYGGGTIFWRQSAPHPSSDSSYVLAVAK